MKRTPLYESHLKAGARMVPFAGWEMPVQFSSITAEHNAVRSAAGIFDVGHMGVVEFKGPDALPFIQYITTNDASKLSDYQAQYSIACNEKGGAVDDLLIYRLPDKFIIIANASNTEQDLAWFEKMRAAKDFEVKIIHQTHISLLSLQGPKAEAIATKIIGQDLSSYKRNRCFMWGDILVSRTGYTGEGGFEFFANKNEVVELWNKLLAEGATPCGLGARDTLRLEAALPLYGHEYDDQTSPVEAGYGWAVKLDKGEFVGRAALKKQKEAVPVKRLVGVELEEKGIPREGYEIFSDREMQQKIGHITSGTLSPTLQKAIGLAFLRTSIGNPPAVYVNIRGRSVRGKVVPLPFYKRS